MSTKTILQIYPFFFGILGFFILKGGMLITGTVLIVFAVLFALINLGLNNEQK